MATNSTPRTVAVVEEFGSSKLKALADRLRHYRAPPSWWASAEEEVHGQAHDAKGKRVAVFVCLFQGAEGDLRVTLTKWSSALPSHNYEDVCKAYQGNKPAVCSRLEHEILKTKSTRVCKGECVTGIL